MHETITLSSGRKCTLQNPALPFLEHYHVLSFPSHQGQPTREEADEIILIATRKARDLGKRCYSDEECFSLIFNGKRTRRKPWLHVGDRTYKLGSGITSEYGRYVKYPGGLNIARASQGRVVAGSAGIRGSRQLRLRHAKEPLRERVDRIADQIGG